MNSFASSLAMLYTAAAIGGMGAGAVYGTCVGNALKWFPDRRGLAAGLTAMGFYGGFLIIALGIIAAILQLSPPSDSGFAVGEASSGRQAFLEDAGRTLTYEPGSS
jgi:MFS family permease